MPDLQSAQPFNQTKRTKRQQDGFIDREYYYPAKPKQAWSLGIRGGTAMINGDINQNFFRGSKPFAPGYTFGAYAKKATSYFYVAQTKLRPHAYVEYRLAAICAYV